MGFDVYDYRTDLRNILVTPQIRARFFVVEVGDTARGHSHDLGIEIFLILQGRAEFEMDGVRRVLEPGQLCIAQVDQAHTVRNVGDVPVIMYLSVTPHIQPTHTYWDAPGQKAAPAFKPSSEYHVPPDRETPTPRLGGQHLLEMAALADAAQAALGDQRVQMREFGAALARGDRPAALAARDAMWKSLAPMFAQVYALAEAWNAFAARTADEEYSNESRPMV